MGGDIQLKKHVEEELRWQPSVDEAAVGVSVHDGIVTLNGRVRSYAEKLAAERAILRISGVKGLATELEVVLAGPHARTDEEIAQAAINLLAADAVVPRNAVKVKVTKGLVTLSGEVEWSYQRHNAQREISRLIGVRGIVNEIEVKPSRSPVSAEVKAGIESALIRSAELDAQRIKVEIRGSTVVLTGTVTSWPERTAAERAAWGAPGVTKVENKLFINSTAVCAVA